MITKENKPACRPAGSYYEVELENSSLHHHQNIVDVNNRVIEDLHLEALVALDPIFAGGYPTALLCAPRDAEDQTKLRSGYYRDIDVYVRDKDHLALLEEWVKMYSQMNSIGLLWTNNAISVNKVQLDHPVQIITMKCGSPRDILDTFDLINCSIAFRPKTGTIILNKLTLQSFLSSEVVLTASRVQELRRSDPNSIATQLYRIYKYAKRWDLYLCQEDIDLFIDLYQQIPNLSLGYTTTKIYSSGGTIDFPPELEDTNIWCLLNEVTEIPLLTIPKAPQCLINNPAMLESNKITYNPTPYKFTRNYGQGFSLPSDLDIWNSISCSTLNSNYN